jgi:hypothetical protein
MKVGRVPIAAIAPIIAVLIRLVARLYYTPAQYEYICLVLDGMLLGVLLCYILYYLNIYVTAWVRNRKEERAV